MGDANRDNDNGDDEFHQPEIPAEQEEDDEDSWDGVYEEPLTNELLIAARAGDLPRVRELVLENRFDVNVRSEIEEKTALHICCECGHFHVADFLIQKGANVHAQNNCEETPFHLACKAGFVDIITLLIENGANVHAKLELDQTAMHYACSEGHLEVAKLLKTNGADLHAETVAGLTPLHVACRDGQLELVMWLVENGANSRAKTSLSDLLLPIHMACSWYAWSWREQNEIVKFFYEKDADILSEKDGHGWTVLHHACCHGRMEIVKSVVRFLRDNDLGGLNAKDNSGRTPFYLAFESEILEMIKFLLENGAKIHTKDEKGRTPLHMAKTLEVARLLISYGADIVHHIDMDGNTPLHHFCDKISKDHLKKASLLMKKGANVNAKNLAGETPLHCACKNGHLKVAKLLVKNRASVHAKKCNGETPLHDACENGYLELVKLLVKNGANVHAENDNQETPLHVAAARNHLEVVWFLVSQHPSLLDKQHFKQQQGDQE